ncbi:hypothetical protein JYQ62_08330 [Nostoc sp. UHCC 0702]|nr:hypothetical protein JYQ62_08330 [Nostoc sp. UHCC 0702]
MQHLTLFSLSTIPTTWVKFYWLWRGEFSLISQTTHGKLTKYQCKYHLFSPEGQYAYSCETTAYSIEEIERDFHDTIDQLISDLIDTQVAPEQSQPKLEPTDTADAATPDNSVREQVTADTCDTVREQTDTVDAPEQNYYVREQVKSATPVTPSVREQKPVIQVAPEHTHWVEEYWVQRGTKKHKYFRYCWMEGRKIRHCHIGGGNVKSRLAQQRKAAVEFALADGQTPSEIEKLIHSSH